MYALLTQLLDIPNYHVVSAEIETDKITLDIESTSQTAALPSLWQILKSTARKTPSYGPRPSYQWQADLSSLYQASILL